MQQILKDKGLFDSVMKEVQESLGDNERGGIGILEEYQKQTEELKKELTQKDQELSNLHKEHEHLLEGVKRDTSIMEKKEQEIERIKRSVQKLQKENAQIKAEQRKRPGVAPAQPVRPPTNPFARRGTMPPQRRIHVLKKEEDGKGWISNNLEYQITNFKDLFFQNLSESLTSMIVKKPSTAATSTEGEGV